MNEFTSPSPIQSKLSMKTDIKCGHLKTYHEPVIPTNPQAERLDDLALLAGYGAELGRDGDRSEKEMMELRMSLVEQRMQRGGGTVSQLELEALREYSGGVFVSGKSSRRRTSHLCDERRVRRKIWIRAAIRTQEGWGGVVRRGRGRREGIAEMGGCVGG